MPVPLTISTIKRQKNGKLCQIQTQYFALNKTELIKLKKCRIEMISNIVLTLIRTNDQYFELKIEREGRIISKEKAKVEPFDAFICVVYLQSFRDDYNNAEELGQVRFKLVHYL